ncbi:MAG: tetratricopeptide repeat protein [bacterium]|nr:tetratricopeptide repeat protein [bacterium]
MNRLHQTPRLGLAVTVAVAIAAYVRTLGFDLVWDDLGLLAYVDQVRAEGGWPALLRAEFRLDVPYGYYRPLILAGLAFDHTFAGDSARLFHLHNVLLHAVNSGLVLLVARRWIGTGLGAVITGLLFAVHPVHVESVAFVSGRTDLLAATWILAAVLVWCRPERSWPPLRLTLFGGVFLLALLAKEVALVLPAALLLLDVAGQCAGDAGDSWTRRNLPWLGAAGVALIVYFVLRTLVADVGFGMLGGPLAANQVAPVRDDPVLLPRIWLAYSRLLVWPWPLNAFHTAPGLTILWPLVATALLGAMAAASWSRQHHRLGPAMLLWIVVFVLPVSGLVPIRGAVIAERFLYLPSVGICVLLGYGAARLLPWLSEQLGPDVRMLSVTVTIAMLGLGAGTVHRAEVWRDEVSLFESIVKASPDAAIAHNNLASAYGKAGRIDEALRVLADAVKLKPDYVEAWTNIGFVHLQSGRPREAVTAYRTALGYDPGYQRARHDLVVAYMEAGDRPAALREYEVLQRTNPDLAQRLAELVSPPR